MAEGGELESATATYAWGRRTRIGNSHLCLREENLIFHNNYMIYAYTVLPCDMHLYVTINIHHMFSKD
jgi:hypothetical protein